MYKTLFSFLLIAFIPGCSSVRHDALTQVSTIDALLASVYDGQMSCGKLLTYGDFGIGTFDKLDGEMIVLDGEVFQAKATGEVLPAGPEMTTPFASVLHFETDQIMEVIPRETYNVLKQRIDRAAPNKNLFLAIRIDGLFSYMKVRAVPRQEKPYPPLVDVTKNQPEYEYKEIAGTIVGFRCPEFVKGVNVPGYHLHFVSDDRSQGGHILEFEQSAGQIRLDRCSRFYMILPEDSEAFGQVDLSMDRSKELHDVER